MGSGGYCVDSSSVRGSTSNSGFILLGCVNGLLCAHSGGDASFSVLCRRTWLWALLVSAWDGFVNAGVSF